MGNDPGQFWLSSTAGRFFDQQPHDQTGNDAGNAQADKSPTPKLFIRDETKDEHSNDSAKQPNQPDDPQGSTAFILRKMVTS